MRRAPPYTSWEDLFDMHNSPISLNISNNSQGINLMLENRSGTPIRDELMNLHKHELRKDVEITFSTTNQFTGNKHK